MYNFLSLLKLIEERNQKLRDIFSEAFHDNEAQVECNIEKSIFEQLYNLIFRRTSWMKMLNKNFPEDRM